MRSCRRSKAAAGGDGGRARARGLELNGPDGSLKLFTKKILETALNEEITEHLGHEKNRPEPGARLRMCAAAPTPKRSSPMRQVKSALTFPATGP